MAPFPYHPEYGMPNVYRLRVVQYALNNSVASAAHHFNVGLSTVYKWVSDYKHKQENN